jgi:hypothetical protein
MYSSIRDNRRFVFDKNESEIKPHRNGFASWGEWLSRCFRALVVIYRRFSGMRLRVE